MPSILTCTECGARMKLPVGFAGAFARCPKCKTAVPVSADEPPAALDLQEDEDEPAPPPRYRSRSEKKAPAFPRLPIIILAILVPIAVLIPLAFVLLRGTDKPVENPTEEVRSKPAPSRERPAPPPTRPNPKPIGPVVGEPIPPPRPVAEPKVPRELPEPKEVKPRPKEVFDLLASIALKPADGFDGKRTWYEVLANAGKFTLPEGPALATAGVIVNNALVIGYADGSTAIWNMLRPPSEAPVAGPKFSAKIDRLWLFDRDRYLVVESGGELVVTTLQPPFEAVKVAVDQVSLAFEANPTANPTTPTRVLCFARTGDEYRVRQLISPDGFWKTGDSHVRGPIPPVGWNTPVPGFPEKLDPPPAAAQFITFLQAKPLAGLPDGRVVVWDGADGKPRVEEVYAGPARSWATSGDSPLGVVDKDGKLRIWREPMFPKRIFSPNHWRGHVDDERMTQVMPAAPGGHIIGRIPRGRSTCGSIPSVFTAGARSRRRGAPSRHR